MHQSMAIIKKEKMIEQGFKNADFTVKEITGYFETRVKVLKPKEDNKKPSVFRKKGKKSDKKRKQDDSNSSVLWFSLESHIVNKIVV